MGLFDKKFCDVCGDKLSLLEGRKLEDGNICKECRNKLSPFFSDRKAATVADIKEQLAYREQNKANLGSFRPNLTIGTNGNMKVYVDQSNGVFACTRSSDFISANPDLIPINSVSAVNIEVKEDRDEERCKQPDGTMKSYVPPRYKYEYTFRVEILVNHRYFSEIEFELTDSLHRPENQYSDIFRNYENMANQLSMALTGRGYVANYSGFMNANGYNGVNGNAFMNGNGIAGAVVAGVAAAINQQNNGYNNGFNGQQNYGNQGFNNGFGGQQNYGNQGFNNNFGGQQNYGNQGFNNNFGGQQNYNNQGFNNNGFGGQQNVNNGGFNNTAWTCTACGAQNTGAFCSSCGAKKTTGIRCDKCGWTPAAGQSIPKFCPNCGDPIDSADMN